MAQWQALGWTLAIEFPLILLLRWSLPLTVPSVVAASASLLTHPIAWRLSYALSPAEYTNGLMVIEIAVVFAEAVWIYAWLRLRFARALWWSLLANAASFLTGLLFYS